METRDSFKVYDLFFFKEPWLKPDGKFFPAWRQISFLNITFYQITRSYTNNMFWQYLRAHIWQKKRFFEITWPILLFSYLILNFRNFDKPDGKISLLGDGSSHFWTSPFSRTPPHHVDWISRRDKTMELEPTDHNGSEAFLKLYLKNLFFLNL